MRNETIETSPYLVLVAGFVVLLVAGGARFAIGLTLKPMVDELGWDRTVLGAAVGIFQIVSAACMFAAGRLADRASPRQVLSLGLLVSGFGIGLMSQIWAPWHALILYGVVFAIGNGMASVIPVGVMITRAFPHRVGLANAVVTSGMSIGQILVVAVLAAVMLTAGWRPVFTWLGLAHLAVLPVLILALRSHQRSLGTPAIAAAGLSLRQAARMPKFWLLLGIYALCGFDDFFVMTHVVAFAQDHHVEAFLASNLLASMGLMALFGVVVAGMWSDRAGPIAPAAASFILRILLFALIAVDQSTVSIVVFALGFGLSFFVTAPLTVVFVRQIFGTRHLGALTGFITMVHHILGGAGAYLGAAVFDRTGAYDPAFIAMLASCVIALVFCKFLGSPVRTTA
jgi:predicted MFS family arabinose efflux permease